MKILVKILIGLGLFLLVIVIAKNEITRFGVKQAIKSTTGLSSSMSKASLGVLHTNIGFYDFVLHNPQGYSDPNFLIFPEIYVDYDLKKILKNDLHFQEVRLNLSEVTVIKNKDGVLNFQQIKIPPSKGPQPKVTIDKLSLKIAKVVYKDYSKNPPTVQEYDMNVNQELKNVEGAQDVVPLITSHVFLMIQKALLKSSIGELSAVGNAVRGQVNDLMDYASGIGKDLKSDSGDLRGKLDQTKDKLKNLFDK